MAEVRFLKSAAKFLKKSKDKQLKKLYQEAIDKICQDYTIGHAKSGDLNGIYGYDIYYNKINHELAYTVEYVNYQIIVVYRKVYMCSHQWIEERSFHYAITQRTDLYNR